CGMLEFPEGRDKASLPAEIRVLSEDEDVWYDFESKYVGGNVQLDIPAQLDGTVTERLRSFAVGAFDALECQGLARADFFVADGGEVVVNEINTMPGFTATSAYPKMWSATGVDYSELLSTLVQTAIARGTGLR